MASASLSIFFPRKGDDDYYAATHGERSNCLLLPRTGLREPLYTFLPASPEERFWQPDRLCSCG